MGPRAVLDTFGESHSTGIRSPDRFHEGGSINCVTNYEFHVLVSNVRLIHVHNNYICKFPTLRITLPATVWPWAVLRITSLSVHSYF